ERHVVLDLAAIADRDVGTCHDILPERAIAADARVRQDMHEMPDPRSRTDLARLVDKGGGMNFRAGMSRRWIIRLGGGGRLQGLARPRQDPQHPQPFGAIGARPRAACDAIEEMPAFEIERLAFGEWHGVGVSATGHWHRLSSLDSVRVQEQLFVPR